MAPKDAAGKKPNAVKRKPDDEPAAVVGIGASAGGLEAFTELIKALPNDTGMAFIFVLHLEPDT